MQGPGDNCYNASQTVPYDATQTITYDEHQSFTYDLNQTPLNPTAYEKRQQPKPTTLILVI